MFKVYLIDSKNGSFKSRRLHSRIKEYLSKSLYSPESLKFHYKKVNLSDYKSIKEVSKISLEIEDLPLFVIVLEGKTFYRTLSTLSDLIDELSVIKYRSITQPTNHDESNTIVS